MQSGTAIMENCVGFLKEVKTAHSFKSTFHNQCYLVHSPPPLPKSPITHYLSILSATIFCVGPSHWHLFMMMMLVS